MSPGAPQPPTAVLLSPGPEAVRAAREVGARIVVVGPDLTARALRAAFAWAHEVVEADWRVHHELVAALGRFAGAQRVSVFGFEEGSALAAARANAVLRLPGNPPQAVAALTSPAALRERVSGLTEEPVFVEGVPFGEEYGVEAHSYCGAHTIVRVSPGGLGPEQEAEVHRLVTVVLDAADYWIGASYTTVIATGAGPRVLAARPCPGSEGLYGMVVAAVLDLPPQRWSSRHYAAAG